jgi:hypothetical protein
VTDKDSSDTETDSGTGTEDVELFMPDSVSLLCSKWMDVFEIECSVKYPCPAYPLLATSRGSPLID